MQITGRVLDPPKLQFGEGVQVVGSRFSFHVLFLTFVPETNRRGLERKECEAGTTGASRLVGCSLLERTA